MINRMLKFIVIFMLGCLFGIYLGHWEERTDILRERFIKYKDKIYIVEPTHYKGWIEYGN